MIRVIQLEQHEKDGLATVLDMLNQAIVDGELAEILNNCGANIGITVDDAYTFLADIFHRYA